MKPLIRANLPQKPSPSAGLLVVGMLALLAGFLIGSPAAAQGGNNQNPDQAQDYIDHTAELLQWAYDLVSETGSRPSRQVFEQAVHLHERSLERLSSGRPLQALDLSRRSRAAMWHSVRLAREAMSLDEQIQIRSERLRELWAHLMERARELNHERAMDFLYRAERQGARARELHLRGNYEPSYRLYEQTEDLVHRAARLLVDAGGPGSLERELERTQQLLERVREKLQEQDDPAAANLLAEAEEALDRAVGHQDRGQPGRALQMAGLARRLAARAASMVGGGTSAEAVQRQIQRFDERAALVGDKLRDNSDQRARNLYGRALDHREHAVVSVADGQAEDALRQIKAAQDLLNQVDDMIR